MNEPVASPLPGQRGLEILACLVVFLAAFLLFVLELTAAKALLPRFGGSAMVWTASMLVYQALLLAGYAYAHGLAGRRSGGVQAGVHIALLAVAVAVACVRLRVIAFSGGDPAAISRLPLADLLWTMLGTIALPFLAVSATSPLVQHWQQRMHAGRPSYWLYAVSNAGSLAGLLAYPFVIEPLLDIERQFELWTGLFALTALGLAAVALGMGTKGAGPAEAATVPIRDEGHGQQPAWRHIALWLALPAGTSALLLAATNELCQDLAVFPFLWVLPLSLYLLSFILTFRLRPLRNMLSPAAVATLVAMGTTSMSLMLPAPVHLASIGALVLVLCAAAHRELYRLRPPARRLTAYYA